MKNSKYFDKHFREARLVEKKCDSCGNWFAIDPVACESLNEAWDVANGRQDWIEYFCPYCRKRQLVCL